MCDPVSLGIASLAITGVGAVVSYSQQKKAAARQDTANEALTASNNELLAIQSGQIDAQAADEIGQRGREARIERGRLAAVMADSGLIDNNGRVMNESRFTEGTDVTAINENRKKQQAQNKAETKAANAAGSARSASIVRPNLFGTGLQIAGAALNQYDKYETRKAGSGKTS